MPIRWCFLRCRQKYPAECSSSAAASPNKYCVAHVEFILAAFALAVRLPFFSLDHFTACGTLSRPFAATSLCIFIENFYSRRISITLVFVIGLGCVHFYVGLHSLAVR